MREIGALNRENVHRLLSATAIYPFTQRLGMSRDEFEVLVARARQEADNPSLKAYFPLCVSNLVQAVLPMLTNHSGMSPSVESPELRWSLLTESLTVLELLALFNHLIASIYVISRVLF